MCPYILKNSTYGFNNINEGGKGQSEDFELKLSIPIYF